MDKNGRIYTIDFERLRYGYVGEDAMFLILSALLPHSIFILPKRHLISLLQYLKNVHLFTKNELLYGTGKYFQFLIQRRIYSSKFLKSVHKDWLFLQYLKKYPKLCNLIISVFDGKIHRTKRPR